MNTIQQQAPPDAVPMNVDVHPVLRKALRQKALDEDLTAKAKLHRILCIELGHPELVDQVPVCVRSRRKPAGSHASSATA